MTFGEYIKNKRIEKNLSLREVSKRSGISHPYLSQLENERNNKPTPEMIKKIAKGLDISYVELMIKAGLISEKNFDNYFRPAFVGETDSLKDFKEVTRIVNELSDIKHLLKKDIEYPGVIWDTISPLYNGHKLTDEERKRALAVLDALFPQYKDRKE